MQKVRLQCENEIIEVDLEVAQQSVILKNMIEDTGKDGEIPLPNLKVSILKKIIEFCEHYRESKLAPMEKPLRTSNLAEIVDEWYANFIDLEKMDDLIDVVVASNF